MTIPEIIDLHMHTTVSDGTDTPPEILSRVKEAGIGLFAVTDHDAVKACGEIRGLLTENDPLFLSGIEFSCKDEEGKYHILGYGYDPEAEALLSVVEKGHGFRMQKTEARLEFLKSEFGFVFPQEEIENLLAMDNPGKPHIGNLLVKYGYVATKDEAIRDYINKRRFRGVYVRPEEAIAGILAAGGIPVLAHPAYGSGDELILGKEMETRLKKLLGYGLQGVEAYYSGFTPKLIAEQLAFASKYNLYVTAGSDYHGTNKLIALGDHNLGRVSDGAPGLKAFLEKALSLTEGRQEAAK